MFSVLIIVIVILIVLYSVSGCKKPYGFPPGPFWWPFLGNLPQLRNMSKRFGCQHLAFSELSQKYRTNVLGLKLGKELVVCVSTHSPIKTVLTSVEYQGRPDNFFFRQRSMGTRKGITGTDGALWKQQRSFVVTHLRALGFGKKTMELMVKDEVREILVKLSKDPNRVDLDSILAPAVLNVLWILTSGSRLNHDSRINELLELLKLRARAFDVLGGVISHFPWLRHLMPELTGYNLVQKINFKLRELIMETIDEHKEKWTEGNCEDLIYSFLTEKAKNQDPESYFTDDQLVMVCLDIFIAGSQTTSNTLNFAFELMIRYPEVQKKVHRYLDEKFPTDEEICFSDKQRVPYIEAVLLEVERYYPVVPISGPRRVLKQTVLNGYTIPKETTVLVNLYSLHYDPTYWKDPENFRPERFLDEEGQLVSHDRFIPFGLGRRKCLGDDLAKTCIFLMFTEILRKYRVEASPETAPPTGKTVCGLTMAPEKYKAKFTARF